MLVLGCKSNNHPIQSNPIQSNPIQSKVRSGLEFSPLAHDQICAQLVRLDTAPEKAVDILRLLKAVTFKSLSPSKLEQPFRLNDLEINEGSRRQRSYIEHCLSEPHGGEGSERSMAVHNFRFDELPKQADALQKIFCDAKHTWASWLEYRGILSGEDVSLASQGLLQEPVEFSSGMAWATHLLGDIKEHIQHWSEIRADIKTDA